MDLLALEETKYGRIYLLLVKKEFNDLYLEEHHIIPKSLEGTDQKNNLVYLSPKAHILAHQLLWKHFKTKFGKSHTYTRKMAWAFHRMMTDSNNRRIPSINQISLSKTAAREAQQGRKLSAETKRKISEGHKGQIPWNKGITGWATEEVSKKISNANKGNQHAKGYKLTEDQLEHRRKINKGENNPMFGKNHSDETKNKIQNANKKAWTLEKRKLARKKALQREKITCIHCNGKFTKSMYSRWHGNNCKKKEF